MSAGYAPGPGDELLPLEEPPAAGGLANFDADAAARNLASVGQLPDPGDPGAPPAPAIPPPVVPTPAPVAPVPQQAAPAVTPLSGAQLAAGGGATPPVPSPGGPPPPPPPPAPTGDPAKDVQNNIAWGRQLTDYHADLTRRQTEADKAHASLEAKRAGAELAAEQAAQKARAEEAAEYKRVRDQRQAAVDQSVRQRAEAMDQAGKSWLETSTTGQKIGAALMILGGGIGAAFRNVAAAQLGQVGNAQNEGLQTVHKLMDQDIQRKKDRLAAASDAVMEARYGYKDAAENHRAALNDLDADTAAKYRLAAKQLESDLKARGATDADIKGNLALADLYSKAQQAETSIHQREEETGEKREAAAAQNKLAEAHLAQGERQIEATAASRKDTLAERHWEHVQAAADRADALAAKRDAKKKEAAEKDDKEIVHDEAGNPYARVPTGRGGAQGFTTRDADYGRAVEQLTALRDDVKNSGSHLLSPEAVNRRNTLYDSAVIGVAAVSPLGKTEEAQKLESGSIGPAGVLDPTAKNFSARGANLEAIDRKIAEVKAQRERYRKETLRPLEGEKSIRTTAESTPAPAKAAPGGTPSSRPSIMKLGGIEYHLQPDGTYK